MAFAYMAEVLSIRRGEPKFLRHHTTWHPEKGTLANDILPFKEIQVGEIDLFRQTECMKKNVYHDFKQSGVHKWIL